MVVQADEMLGLGTVVVAPTSRSAPPVSFRPIIDIGGTPTNVLVDQIYAADPSRFEASAGRLTASEIARVDEGLAVILGL